MREPYSKHKDRSPKDTVGSIVSTLEEVGLSTEVRWTSHPFEGLCSNRVTIAGTNIGTNGKGTSEEYCLASGYAEFMERLQNNILGSTALTGAQIFERRGFLAAPDDTTFGLTLFFPGAHDAHMTLFGPNGPANQALRCLEALGVADHRWLQAARNSFALPVPLTREDGTAHVIGATCQPDCVKLKWKNGRLAPARWYQLIRVASLGPVPRT